MLLNELLNEAPILVVCDNAQLRNDFITRIARTHSDVVSAANEYEARQRIEHFKFAAVGSRSTIRYGCSCVDAARKQRSVLRPRYGCGKAAQRFCSAQDAVAVNDVHLVVPTL